MYVDVDLDVDVVLDVVADVVVCVDVQAHDYDYACVYDHVHVHGHAQVHDLVGPALRGAPIDQTPSSKSRCRLAKMSEPTVESSSRFRCSTCCFASSSRPNDERSVR